jgi:hypothetical protein
MGRLGNAARKEKLLGLQMGRRDPGRNRVPRLLGVLELNWALCLLLHANCARGNMTTLDHIAYAQPDQIALAGDACWR